VTQLSIEDRYDYFIRKVADFEEVWGLFSDQGGRATLGTGDKIVVPFWPEEDFAVLCATEQWQGYVPKMISLEDFMAKWIPGLQRDQRLVNIFYVPQTKEGSIIEPGDLLSDLENELSNYE
jgi:hypothetical protein